MASLIDIELRLMDVDMQDGEYKTEVLSDLIRLAVSLCNYMAPSS